ncbi:MAG: hypothetical protein QOF61_3339, partial [Acidobacteriota bacterium]|nr:hypothetical protein [Acidobacteriota bacterium]
LAADSRAQRAATTAGASGTSTAVKKAGTEEGANAPRVSEAPSAPPPETPSAPPEPAAEIEALIARARADDYYDMLGVAHHADKSDVKRAYYALAKRFHPDRFRRAADADTLSRIEGAFAEIARAYETLREPRERASYDSKLAAQSSQRGGQATGEGRQSRDSAEGSGASQSRAEESFQQGLAATQRGDVAAAALHFGEAVRLSPQQARYHALYGRALMADTHARRQAEAELRAAMTLDPQNASYHVALAELYIMIGLQRRAKGELERALSLDPQNTAAKRMLERMKGK